MPNNLELLLTVVSFAGMATIVASSVGKLSQKKEARFIINRR